MRRDGWFWGWIMGNPHNNHLWRLDSDVEPPRLNALCHQAAVERSAVLLPLRARKDGTPPAADRCAECNWKIWYNKKHGKRA